LNILFFLPLYFVPNISFVFLFRMGDSELSLMYSLRFSGFFVGRKTEKTQVTMKGYFSLSNSLRLEADSHKRVRYDDYF